MIAEWKRDSQQPWMAAAKSNAASDVAWRFELASELGVSDDKAAASFTVDLEKFYEGVLHELLVQNAKDTQFPE